MHLQRNMWLLVASVSVASITFAGNTQQRQLNAQTPERQPAVSTPQPAPDLKPQERPADVPYVPTPDEVVDKMFELASVKGDDILYDLGSGDGRIVIRAAQKFGTRGVGVEINPRLVQLSRENAKKAAVADRVQFLQQDLYKTDFSKATVVMLYLLPHVNMQLRPKLLRELKPGTRIVSHNYDMGDWKPERVVQMEALGYTHTIYYWVVPKLSPYNNVR